jgi:hypothetical protein
MITSNNKPTKEVMIKELLDFRKFHVDVKDIKSLVMVGKSSF